MEAVRKKKNQYSILAPFTTRLGARASHRRDRSSPPPPHSAGLPLNQLLLAISPCHAGTDADTRSVTRSRSRSRSNPTVAVGPKRKKLSADYKARSDGTLLTNIHYHPRLSRFIVYTYLRENWYFKYTE